MTTGIASSVETQTIADMECVFFSLVYQEAEMVLRYLPFTINRPRDTHFISI